MAMNDNNNADATRVVNSTVLEKEQAADGWHLIWDKYLLQSDFPCHTYKVSDDLASRLTAGQSYTVELVRGTLKSNKDGSSKSGSKLFDYNWKLVKLAEPGTQPTPTPEPSGSATHDPTRRSIERQTALIQATLLGAAHVSAGTPLEALDVLKVADVFHAWIQGNQA